jgi:hypothetical protein
MKPVITIILFLLLATTWVAAQNKDLPGPSQNLRNIAVGSYIIPMDNTYQPGIGPSGMITAGFFNLKAYGLAVFLLNNQVPLKWCIRAGKFKDDPDIQTFSEQIKPTAVLGGVSTNFRGGPFIIEAVDTTGVAALIDAYYALKGLTGNYRPRVYRLTVNQPNVDIRYDMTGYVVRAAILNDGGWQNLHENFMTIAGIPANNYKISNGTDLVGNCFTFASEPHNSASGLAVDAAITGIKNFVTLGGNFLAQCAAVSNYENSPLGRFQTTTGVVITNSAMGTSLIYPNADLSYSQFEGVFDGSGGGTLQNWQILSVGANNQHYHAKGTGSFAFHTAASVSKFGTGTGGLVFYLGNHTFSTGSQASINGIRMYMNALMTPARYNCPVTVLPVQLTDFTAQAGARNTDLSWTIASNEQVSRFEVERSFDGRSFSFVAGVPANFTNNEENYDYTDQSFNAVTYYRIRINGRDGKVSYSHIVKVNGSTNQEASTIRVMNNPLRGGDMIFTYNAKGAEYANVQVLNASGMIVYSKQQYFTAGMTQISVPESFVKAKGTYIIQVTNQNIQKVTAKATKL